MYEATIFDIKMCFHPAYAWYSSILYDSVTAYPILNDALQTGELDYINGGKKFMAWQDFNKKCTTKMFEPSNGFTINFQLVK